MGYGTAGLLLAMVGGYWVLERASAHKGQLKQIGQAVGAIVLVVSLVGVACKVWYLVTGRGGCCPVSKSAFCPYSARTGPGADSTN